MGKIGRKFARKNGDAGTKCPNCGSRETMKYDGEVFCKKCSFTFVDKSLKKEGE